MEVCDVLHQPIRLNGIRTATNANTIWFADRAEWFMPKDIEVRSGQSGFGSLKPEVSQSFRLLGQSFDLGLLSQVRLLQKNRLQPDENAAFYGLIAASTRTPVPANVPTSSIVDCLQRPAELAGQPVQGEARVVRVTRVTIEEETTQQLSGTDHYYELNVLCNIGNRSIKLVANKGNDPLVFEGEFPTTIVSPTVQVS